ncbi:hypothetical protein DM02DRAFT_40909 [Periconia macrospinosa]|uniref:non-specific serine/threonine protein kinase n=1 Tax=Periconia macrospinosa TaxID=97972 RepID=A0A2V1DL47_9PLEO|nr:hypothetical protein DM02DRAFT_40909 [Periconia macrospinosa]
MQVEQVLSLDLESTDYLYRIRRDARIVYVSVQYTTLIPDADRTDSSRILAILRTLPGWQGQWTTLTVTNSKGLSTKYDVFKPHRLAPTSLVPSFPRYNFLDFTVVERISDRVSMVSTDRLRGKNCVRKIARFSHELKAIKKEIEAYHFLHGFPLIPKFMGYVYEETCDRVVGFLIEALEGRHPSAEDYEICQSGMFELHKRGVVHGDLNKYNIFIDGGKAKFVDFEVASFQVTDDKNYKVLEREEAERLPKTLVGD